MMSSTTKRGFSLIEMLLAIFILGIGIISIATLFPAGIAQQQKSTDDIIGPIISRNAMTLIRSRVSQDDFGGSEQFESRWSPELCGFNITDGSINPWPTICGDWMWRRPAMVTTNYGDDDQIEDVRLRGAIDLFALRTSNPGGIGTSDVLVEYWTDQMGVPGLPYNREKYQDNLDPDDGSFESLNPPIKRILAGERQYPMWYGAEVDRPEAQYYWDCMFRRYEGRILVAIFVYRVVDPSQTGKFTVDTSGLASPDWPRRVNLQSDSSTNSWHAAQGGDVLIGSELDDPTESLAEWQYPGQWIVDQNGNVHTVQRGRRRANDDTPVRLTAVPSELPVFEALQGSGNPGVNVNWWDKTLPQAPYGGFIQYGVVTDIWFTPTKDAQGRKIIPVFATVQEL